MAAQRALIRLVAAALLAAGAFVGLARGLGQPAAGTGTSAHQLHLGVVRNHLVDESGRTVYAFSADPAGRSTCGGACALYWPPVTVTIRPIASASVDAERFSTFRRPDGRWQVTYAGRPLYYYNADVEIGDTYGQGRDSFGGPWWEVDATGSLRLPR